MKWQPQPIKFEPEKEVLSSLKNKLRPSQAKALDDLRFFWKMKKSGIQNVAGIHTRPIPLVVGASGTGKTYLVKSFAEDEKIDFWSININNWIVRGAAKAEATLPMLCKFVQNNPCGLIFIDEVDKMNRNIATETAWTADCQSEIFALLDGNERLIAMEWTPDVLQKFKTNFMLVGAGAWQDITSIRRKQRSCGFGKSEEINNDPVKKIKDQSNLADELLYRFNEKIIFIEPPDKDEFAQRIRSIREELKLPALSDAELNSIVLQAVESNCHFRFLESYLGNVLREANVLDNDNCSNDFIHGVFAPTPRAKISKEKINKDFEQFQIELKKFADACAEFESEVLRREAEWLDNMKIRPSILLGIKLGRNNLRGDLAGQIRQIQEAIITWNMESSSFEERRACESIIIHDGGGFFETLKGHLRVHSEVGEKFHAVAMRAYVAFQKVSLIHEHLMNHTDPKF